MLSQPSQGPGKVRPVRGVHGSETTEFPRDEAVLGQAVWALQAPARCGCSLMFSLSSHLAAPQLGVATALDWQGRIHCAWQPQLCFSCHNSVGACLET